MASRVSLPHVALLFWLAPSLILAAGPPGVLVSYSFDDDQIDTGPDTFAVFEAASGHVELTSAFRYSGYHSVEIREVAGDHDFPELQGYFPLRKTGTLYAHFALLTTDPGETFNIALAGPNWFALRKDGIGFWLQARDGTLRHYSDSIPKKLMPLRAFTWYIIDVVYEIDAGTYDLTIHEEGSGEPVVTLEQQKNAANQQGSAVDKFSFIGDTGIDTSNAVYYVDDVVLSVDEPVDLPPLIAPGRRKLFIDAWSDYQRLMRSEPGCLPATGLADFGLETNGTGGASGEQLRNQLKGALHTSEPRVVSASDTTASGPGIRAIAIWAEGCSALRDGRSEKALAAFEAAARESPGGRIYPLSSVLALARLGRWDEADFRLGVIGSQFRDDLRITVASALVGLMRDDLEEALDRLRAPAERLEDDRVAEHYFLALLWNGSHMEAEDYAIRMAAHLDALGVSPAPWVERAGDAAFFYKGYSRAEDRYTKALRMRPDDPLLLAKLSDIQFVLGDLEQERVYRERVFGRLQDKDRR